MRELVNKKQNVHQRENGWWFFQPACASSVICAERKLGWYDEEKFNTLEKSLKKQGCRTYFTIREPSNRRMKKTSVIEIYKIFKDTEFLDKIEKMKEIIKENNIC